MMQSGSRLKMACGVTLCVLSCLVSFLCFARASEAAGLSATLEAGLASEALTADPFASEPLEGLGEGGRAVEEARRATPEAVAAREASLTKFENLNATQVVQVAGESFPAVINQTAGGPPRLPTGETIVGFPSVTVAQVDLGSGKRAVIDSLQPIAVESSPGHRVPVNLQLQEVGGAFEPSTPISPVRIPKRLGGGTALQESGVSVTPVDTSGASLASSEGALDGATVLYANTQTDADTVVKPVTFGFDLATVLRSLNSPRELYFRLGVPAAARIVQPSGISGPVRVMSEGAVLATVQPPTAVDAAGTPVPVSMKLVGDTLALSVDLTLGEYQYPVYVDPTVTDKEIFYNPGQWLFLTNYPAVFKAEESEVGRLNDQNENKAGKPHGPAYFSGDWGFFSYTTQGASRIYELVATARELHEEWAPVVDQFELRTGAGIIEPGNGEGGKAAITEPEVNGPSEHVGVTICREATCAPVAVAGSEQNAAYFEQKATAVEAHWGEHFSMSLTAASVLINQETAPTASFDTTSATIEGLPNALLSSKWYRGNANAIFGINAVDIGIGIYKQGLSSPNKAGWGYTAKNEARNECRGVQCNECYEPPCAGIRSGTGKPLTYTLAAAAGGELPEGEDTIQGKVEDDVGLSATASGKLKIDNAPPKGFTLSGLPSNHEISDGQHFLLKGSATDGVTGTPSSGLASILLELDGKPLTGGQGSCTPGPCTGTGEWTLNGEAYAAGQHALTLLATDNAGNVASEEYVVSIHHPQGVSVGPGSLNPTTGEVSLTSSDVALSVPGGALMVVRSYRSRHLTQGTEGPLGPQWSLSVGPQASLSRVPSGMVLTGSSGGQQVFASNGTGGFTSPTGDASLSLAEKTVEGKTVFTLSENGSVTTFELPSGSSGSVWTPSSSEGPNGTNATIYKFRLAGGVIEPTEELAPVPAGVSCGKEISELKAGCRALRFEYATETKAKGQKASEWGSVTGHLSQVFCIAWDPTTKAKTERVVAEYTYDVTGRLRAVWDPRITPELKTTYGYDSEGHVTAVSAPGLEPSLLEHGTTPSDAATGRLLAVSVPSAAAALGNGEAPANTEAPVLSSTKPAVGTKISVNLTAEKTPGKWSASPLAFTYQWDDCNAAGKECTPVPGAVNEAYYPVPGDEGRTLVAQITALNATGATAAMTAVTSTVAGGTPNTPLPEPPFVGSNSVTTIEYQVPLSGSSAPYAMSSGEVAKWGQTAVPYEATAIFPPDKAMGWPAKKYERETVLYIDGKDRAINTASPTGGISTTEYNSYNDAVRTLTPANRQKALNEGAKSAEASQVLDTESTYEETGSEPGTRLLSTLGPIHNVQLTGGTQAEARTHTVYSYNEGAPAEGGPYHLVTTMTEGAWLLGKDEPASVRTTKTAYNWKLRKPTAVTIDPSGLNLTTTTKYSETTGAIIETSKPAKSSATGYTYSSQFGSFGTGKGQLEYPKQLAVDSKGNIWVADEENNRISVFSEAGAFVKAIGWGVTDGKAELEVCKAEATKCQAGIAGTGSGQFKGPKGLALAGTNVWISDTANNRLEELTEAGVFTRSVGTTGAGKLQFNSPRGLTIDPTGNVLIADAKNQRIEKLNEKGEFISVLGWGVLDGKAELEVCKAEATTCQIGLAGTGNGEFNEPKAQLVDTHNNLVVSDGANNRLQVLNEKNEFVKTIGSLGAGQGQFSSPKEIKQDSHGNMFVVDEANNRVEELNEKGEFVQTFGWGVIDGKAEFETCTKEASSCKAGIKGSGAGELNTPWGLTVDAQGNVKISEEGNHRVETFKPASTTGNPEAHTTKTAYYSAKTESPVTACQNRPEYANLPCETYPAAQPGTSGLPELPITETNSYNLWGEPETTTETVGATKRTQTHSYDGAGRPKTQAVSSTVGTALPAVTNEYSTLTGLLEKQSVETKTITSIYNKLGQLETYTDADGNTSSYEYDVAGRVKKTNDGKGTQTASYSSTTGLLIDLADSSSAGMKFTASYDAEGHMLTETYPNGMSANYTYDATGRPISLEYKKTNHCTVNCIWFSDTIAPSIHGQWLSQTSTFSKQAYTYDQAGRLQQVQNTPTGKTCTTRKYAYDEDTNRTSLTTFEPNAKGECATETGTTETHSYDTADRLIDTGVSYNTFGDVTALPAADAANVPLTSTYYTHNQVASQTQGEETIGYALDPAARTRESVATGPKVSDIISHYAGPSNSPSWTINTPSEWRRSITGISGTLVAIQNNAETPVLQLTNLHGDIVATALKSETATELATKADTSEFGVPGAVAPAKYSWLGAIQIPTEELPAGLVSMGSRSYVPGLGRFLQPDPISAGSANAYSYTHGDPVNSSDPTGAYDNTASAALQAIANQQGQEIAARRMGEIKREEYAAAERRGAELAAQAAAEAAASAAAVAGPQYAEEWEEWEEYEEWEGEYEYAAFGPGLAPGTEGVHPAPALLVEPFSVTAESNNQSPLTPGSPVPLCQAGTNGPCARDARGSHGNCGGNSRCKAYRRSHPIGSSVHGGNMCDGIGAILYATPEGWIPIVAGKVIGAVMYSACG
jgi:RHS repeat-associated protein